MRSTNDFTQFALNISILVTLWKKIIITNHKLQNDNGRRDREERLCSPTGHKLIILSSELQVGDDSCLIWFCRQGDLIL